MGSTTARLLPKHCHPSYQTTKSNVSEDISVPRNILLYTSVIAVILPFFIADDKSKNGIIFRGLGNNTACNNGLVVSVIFAFACSLSDLLLLSKKPNASRLFRLSAVMSLAVALALFSYALFLSMFKR